MQDWKMTVRQIPALYFCPTFSGLAFLALPQKAGKRVALLCKELNLQEKENERKMVDFGEVWNLHV